MAPWPSALSLQERSTEAAYEVLRVGMCCHASTHEAERFDMALGHAAPAQREGAYRRLVLLVHPDKHANQPVRGLSDSSSLCMKDLADMATKLINAAKAHYAGRKGQWGTG